MGLNHLNDVGLPNARAGIVKTFAEHICHRTSRPRNYGGHKLGHHDSRLGSQHGKRGAEREPHAQPADQ